MTKRQGQRHGGRAPLTGLRPVLRLVSLLLVAAAWPPSRPALAQARAPEPSTQPPAAAPPRSKPFSVHVQDVARLQGQRTNKLMGYGLVVGLNGTGDGEKYASTMRSLMALHRRYAAPVVSEADLKGNNSAAIVAVEVTIPEYGAREGERLDVVVSVIGKAKSLAGGQLLTTPLQYPLLDPQDPATQQIYALAGGRIDLPDKSALTRGVIREGATLEADFLYSFIDGQYITLVLDDGHAGWTWAQMVAKAVNHANGELLGAAGGDPRGGRALVQAEVADALGPKNVRVRIPTAELARPAGFISRVLQTELFDPPAQPALVTINRTTKNISFTGSVRISPTVLQIPSFGTVSVGGGQAAPGSLIGLDTQQAGGVEFQDLLQTLSALHLSSDQMIEAVEHLHKAGSLHAQLRYEE
jgi:flagellar P-ring protein precursor FlgI